MARMAGTLQTFLTYLNVQQLMIVNSIEKRTFGIPHNNICYCLGVFLLLFDDTKYMHRECINFIGLKLKDLLSVFLLEYTAD